MTSSINTKIMFACVSPCIREYLAFRILKNYTLRSDNVAASIQADNDTPVDAAQFAVPAYYVDSATGSSFADKAEAHISATLSAVSDAEAQGSKAFLVSPTSAVATGDQSDSSIVLQAGSDSFNLPFPQPSASVYTTSFDLSNTSMNWSPATRFLFGELSLPSATAVSFAGRSNMMSLNTPMRPNFENAGERPQTVNNNAISTASTTATNSSSSYPFVEGAETSLALLPPPTPSAFSSFPNLKSPGLSRYFPSAGGSSAYSI